jgi:AcrR family transcriptional regulator
MMSLLRNSLADVAPAHGWDFALCLQALEAEEGLAKGERTRRRLKTAAARALAAKGYHELQMGDICQEAGVSQGAIYKYFRNKTDVTVEVLTDFIHFTGEHMLAVREQETLFERLLATHRVFVSLNVANVGLTRCVRQLVDEVPEIRKLSQDTNAAWAQAVAASIRRHCGHGDDYAPAAFELAMALGSMFDEYFQEIFVRENPHLAYLKEDPEGLAESVSVMWYRMAFGSNPPSHELTHAKKLSALTRQSDG